MRIWVLEDLIICMQDNRRCSKKPYLKNISNNWDKYYKIYKTIEEKIVVNSVNKDLELSLSKYKNKKYFKKMLKKIDFLVEYEIEGAYKQRRVFLEEYSNMKDYLMYALLALTFVTLFIIILIIDSIIKKDNHLNFLNKKYKLDSITDGMTKLNNRKYFDTIFDQLPNLSKQKNWQSAFFMFDIDHFKQYNDTYGHDMGDIALKKVANVLKDYFDKELEYVFRLGGEEFGVILFDTNIETCETCLRDINKKIVELQIEHKTSLVLDVISISTGAVIFKPNSNLSSNKLYKMADKKLYLSKENGRNTYTI